MPGGTAVHVPLETSRNSALDAAALRDHKPAGAEESVPRAAEQTPPEAEPVAAAPSSDKRKTVIFAVTILLFLLAFAGLAGLAWFILR